MPEAPDLVAEARDPATSSARLLELAGSPEPEIAAAAAGRMIRESMESARGLIAGATDPRTQVAVAIGLIAEALQVAPGRIAAFSTADLGEALGLAGWDPDSEIIQALLGVLARLVDSLSPEVQEVARGIAPSWDGSLLDLFAAAAAVLTPPASHS